MAEDASQNVRRRARVALSGVARQPPRRFGNAAGVATSIVYGLDLFGY